MNNQATELSLDFHSLSLQLDSCLLFILLTFITHFCVVQLNAIPFGQFNS